MSGRRSSSIRLLTIGFLVVSASAAGVKRVAARQMDDGPATLHGVVVDSVTSLPVVGARVGPATGKLRALSDAQGRFELRGLPAGPVEITVEQLGYEAWSDTLDAGALAEVRIALRPDPLILPQVAVYADRLRARRNSLATTSVRAWNAAEIAMSPAADAEEFVEQHGVTPLRCPVSIIATNCVLRRGRVVAPAIFVNDVRYPPGLETLRNFDIFDAWQIEVLGYGAQIRLYTKAYAERLALGMERMLPVIY